MYSVVDFVDSPNGSLKSIDVVPSTWLKNGKCFWPPYSNTRLLQAAAVTCAAPDPAEWTLHNVSILCTASKPKLNVILSLMLKIQTDIYPFLLHVFFSPADYATAVHKCEKLTRTAQLTSESEVDDIVPLRPMDASMDESLERGCLPPFPDAE